MEKSTAVNFKEQWTVQIVQNKQKEQDDDVEDRFDFWSNSENFYHRHHFQQRGKLCAPKEGSFPIPLKNVDVASRTNCHIGCFARQSNQ